MLGDCEVKSGRIYWYGFIEQDSLLNVPIHTSDKGTGSLFGWLAEEQLKSWPTGNDMEMLVEEGNVKDSRKFEDCSGFAK